MLVGWADEVMLNKVGTSATAIIVVAIVKTFRFVLLSTIQKLLFIVILK